METFFPHLHVSGQDALGHVIREDAFLTSNQKEKLFLNSWNKYSWNKHKGKCSSCKNLSVSYENDLCTSQNVKTSQRDYFHSCWTVHWPFTTKHVPERKPTEPSRVRKVVCLHRCRCEIKLHLMQRKLTTQWGAQHGRRGMVSFNTRPLCNFQSVPLQCPTHTRERYKLKAKPHRLTPTPSALGASSWRSQVAKNLENSYSAVEGEDRGWRMKGFPRELVRRWFAVMKQQRSSGRGGVMGKVRRKNHQRAARHRWQRLAVMGVGWKEKALSGLLKWSAVKWSDRLSAFYCKTPCCSDSETPCDA